MGGARRTCRGDGEEDRRQALATSLAKLAAKSGPNITLRQFCRAAGIPASHVYRDFDTWTDLRRQAGLTPSVDRSAAAAKHSRVSLLQALRTAIDEAGEDISLTRFGQLTGISVPPIIRVFGSWQNLRRAAGLSPHARTARKRCWQREDLLTLLRDISRDRPQITLREFCDEFSLSSATVDRLGPWTDLRRQLGLPPRGSRRKAGWTEWNRDLLIPWHEEPSLDPTSHHDP